MYCAISSVLMRERENTMVFTPAFSSRVATRWLSSDAPDPVTLAVPDAPAPGDTIPVQLDVRDAAFNAVADATVEATLTSPGGEPVPLALRPSGAGQHAATLVAETAGLYRIRAEARRGATMLGVAEGTSKARLFEARGKLREALRDFNDFS